MGARLILLVEDNADDAELTLRALKKGGVECEVTVAPDGPEALAFLAGKKRTGAAKAPRAPTVIFLDLKLPKMDGAEVLRRIRNDEKTRHLPVVIFSSSVELADVLRCYLAGASSYVRKPIDYSEFAQTVGDLARYWLHVNVPAVGPADPEFAY